MRREGFDSIFRGLLFVVLDVRLGSIDLILPDFIGYILIFKGLSLLAPEHRGFRKARVLAAVMFFVSIPSLVEMGSDPRDPAFLRRQLMSGFTGDLGALLPQKVHSARLLRTTSSRSSIDANRTQNPQRDEDAVLGEYSDGTVVLILRYASPEEALRAMHHKTETDYSFEAIQKRAETDESFRAQNMSAPRGESSSDGRRLSAYSNVEAADRVIQQWWNRGWSWWNPSDRDNQGGWSSRILYIVEGYRSSAGAYKAAFEGERRDKGGITVNPLFPVSIIGDILNTMMIWEICAGIMALSLSLNQYDLMNVANRLRVLYLALTVMGWALSMTWFLAPEPMSRLFHAAAGVIVIYALVGMIAMLLIMALMRRAANSLQG
ncbi:MAG TPA: hypothetical protein VEK57_17400 [Thermoanaerobaculia bacterium]|nr:hypothetical protein [Thermoanaerobaculia bacterium]